MLKEEYEHHLQSIHPGTGEVLGEVAKTPIAEVSKLYARAQKAYKGWAGLSLSRRISYLRELRHYLAENLDQIVETVAKDTGKAMVEALVADLMPVLDSLKYIEDHGEKILGQQKKSTPIFLYGKDSYVEYMPRGVVLIISPWNYPFQLALIPAISALAGGNTVILKPSEVTPLVGKIIEEIATKSSLPDDILQVAHGGKELGQALTAAKPDYIFFTGSVQTGKIIQQQAAKDLIPTTLELGGKDAMIVFSDANLKRAAKGAVWGAFTNSGQVCVSTERLYVERSIYDQFVQMLVEEVAKLRQGVDRDADIGTMTFPGQVKVVKEHIEDALANGAQLASGQQPSDWDFAEGLFIPPTILTQVNQQMKIVQEETFGPVLPVIPFDREQDLIRMANDTVYGLNASIWSSYITKAKRLASQLEVGSVVINDLIINLANPHLPFGGTKMSGLGSYHGEGGLRTFCIEKAIMVDQGKKDTELAWFPYEGKYTEFLKLTSHYFSKDKSWLKSAEAFLKLRKK